LPRQTTDIRSSKLLEGPILRSILTLAAPIVLSNILQAGYQLTDAFWVGRLGGTAVAAVSVSFPVMFLTMAVGIGFGIAGTTLIAQYFGAGNTKMVDHVAAQTLLMIFIISVVLGAIGYLISPWFLHLLGVAPDVYPGALGFMRVSFIGLIFNFFFFMFQSIIRGVGEVTLPVYIVLGTVALNFALDPLFIFGYGPIPASGVMGAALATLSTQTIAALMGLVILMRGKHGVKIHIADFRPDPEYIKRAFFLGLPASIEQSGRALGLTVMTFLITSFGTLSIAAWGVGSNVLQVVMIPAMGLSMAIGTLVGQNIGAGNIERADRIGRFGGILGFGILSAFGILVFFAAPHFVAFFVPNDQPVIDAGAIFLRIMALSWGCIGLQFCLTGALRASGSMVVTMVLTLVSQWVLQLPIAYFLSQHSTLGANGIWWSIPISNVITALITIAVYRKGDWKKKKLIGSEEKLEAAVSQEIFAEEGVRN
jgi:putative MATE family efflux protein